ncbi:MAG: glycosyltransferase, partial [Caulobacterales bacterium]|nr:glycosyltransferase [Caulobacterales bacterium]
MDAQNRQDKLRICYVSQALSHGVGRHVVDLMRLLGQRGHEMHLIHATRDADPDMLAAIADSAPAGMHAVSTMRRPPSWRDIPAAWSVGRYLARHGPFDIIHGVSSKGGALMRLNAPFTAGAKIYGPQALITMSAEISPWSRMAFTGIERTLAPLCDRIICSSIFERDHAVSLGLRPDKLVIVENGVPASTFQNIDRYSVDLPADRFIVGFVGRFAFQKAPEMLVGAAEHVAAANPSLLFVMFGDGPQRAELERRVKAAGIAD